MATMGKRAYVITACLALCVYATLAACRKPADNPTPQNLAPIMAEKLKTPPPAPVDKEKDNTFPNIKVRRGKDGSYTWEITGRDVSAILKADRELSRKLGARGGAGRPGQEE